MPITKSAQKALRQSRKRRQRNLLWKSKIKKLRKEIKTLAEEKKIQEAKKSLSQFYKVVDKAVKNNVIKKNTASRRKSQMAQVVGK